MSAPGRSVAGSVAFITGAASGMGRATAEVFAQDGAHVAICDISGEAVREVADDLVHRGLSAEAWTLDIGDAAAIDTVVAAAAARFGGLDIVVNNAANALALPIGQLTVEGWEKSLGVNLRGPVFLVERALPHLIESPHAVILNVISAGAFLFSADTSMYAAAKAGLMAMTRSQASSLAKHGIRSNALAPGTVDTDMVRNTSPEQQESMKNASPMRRAADTDEMAAPALFLVSDASSYMTGQVLLVDGGLTPH